METIPQLREIEGDSYAKNKRRKSLGILLMKIVANEYYSNDEKKEFPDFFYSLDMLDFKDEIEERLFLRMIAFIALSKDMSRIPLNYRWIVGLYEKTLRVKNNPLNGLYKIAGNEIREKDKKVNFNKRINNIIGKVLAQFFIEECAALKEIRITSALDTKDNLTWGLFPLWLYKRYPGIYKRINNKRKSRYASLKDIPFEQIILYLPIFVLRKLDGYFDNKKNIEFVHYLATGHNIRKADFLPFKLTRKMAFHFHDLFYNRSMRVVINREYIKHPLMLLDRTYTANFSFGEPLVFAFVQGLGGNYNLAKEFYDVYANINDYDFQKSIVEFCVKYKINDQEQLKRLLGYVNHMRRENGTAFTLKGRTLLSLSRDAEEYYEEQQRQNDINFMMANGLLEASWYGADYKDFELETWDMEYKIVQLCNAAELVEESRTMNHCVRSYAGYCINNTCSIWSLKGRGKKDLKWKSLVTIEINESDKIVQAKAKYNARPEEDWMEMINDWAKREKIKVGEAL